MKKIMGKSILLLVGSLLLLCILPIPAAAWPPPCPSPCEYWNGYECVCHEECCYDSDCDGLFECYSCNLDTCTCEDDQSKCSGCCKCDYGMCVDDDSKCGVHECCIDCVCVDPICDNCHMVGHALYECGHTESDVNCQSDYCIINSFSSASCDYKGPDWPCWKKNVIQHLMGTKRR